MSRQSDAAEVVALNADTTRDAVEKFVHHLRSRKQRELYVVATRTGSFGKVVFELPPTPGWYAYFRKPLSEPAVIKW